ncbi:hypothetical protein [uncultured Sphaerotilus sp.]|uniref:hypothetical protein n=1 Tax=uncultured Sphaerotilus sp. TaxID=474984 RepID=UPI0030CA492B
MGQFRLNAEILKTLRVLIDIESNFLDEILENIDGKISPCLSIEDEISSVISRIKSPQDVKYINRYIIAESIVGVHFLKQNARMRVVDFLNEIVKSADDLDDSIERHYIGENKNSLYENLLKILTSDVISTSTKSVRLLQASEKIFLKSSVITEIRPVFHDDVDDKIMGSLVMHELKVSYRISGDINDVFLTLDSVDIRELRDTLDRALLKAGSIEKRIKNDTNVFGSLIEVDSDV